MSDKKKWQTWLVLLLLLLLAAALVIVSLLVLKKEGAKTRSADLLSGDWPVQLPADAQERFSNAVRGTDLEKIFLQESINIFYPGHPWLGRVRESGISRQALFSVGGARVVYEIEGLEDKELLFSIYNPEESQLSYRILLEEGRKKKIIFNKSFADQQLVAGRVQIDTSFRNGSDVRLVFETRGKGIGAWINPRFARPKKRPRLVAIIMLDTVRRDHTSLYGYERKTTPQMDKLAADGQVFLNAYSTTSWTLPAHVSLFSGKDLSGHRVTGPQSKIPADIPLLAELFQANGFVTAAFTGGGFVDDQYGFHRGFALYSNLPGRVFNLKSAEMVLSHAKNFMEQFWGEDMFLFLHTYQVHAPYKFAPQYVRRFNNDLHDNLKGPGNFIRDKKTGIFKPLPEEQRRLLVDLYDTAILYADETLVGGMVRYLKDKGAYNDALVAVLSDHGEEFYDHGAWEHGHTLYNELIKIPLVIKYPGSKQKGVEDALASIGDIPGLMLSALGIPHDEDDFSVRPGERERVMPILFPQSPIIAGIPAKVSFVSDRYHFIYNMIDPAKIKAFDPQPHNMAVYELYVRSDAQERHNLARKEAQVMNGFRPLLRKYLALLKNLAGETGKLDKELEKELKSLGYLND